MPSNGEAKDVLKVAFRTRVDVLSMRQDRRGILWAPVSLTTHAPLMPLNQGGGVGFQKPTTKQGGLDSAPPQLRG